MVLIMRYDVYKAGEVMGPVPDVTINIGPAELPNAEPMTREDQFERDAHKLADALFAALPGGTIDHLTAELLRRQARRIVPHRIPDDAG